MAGQGWRGKSSRWCAIDQISVRARACERRARANGSNTPRIDVGDPNVAIFPNIENSDDECQSEQRPSHNDCGPLVQDDHQNHTDRGCICHSVCGLAPGRKINVVERSGLVAQCNGERIAALKTMPVLESIQLTAIAKVRARAARSGRSCMPSHSHTMPDPAMDSCRTSVGLRSIRRRSARATVPGSFLLFAGTAAGSR
jgi:hypothetical protein